MLLVIDHYDSFVHNLARYLHRLGQEVRVIRHTAIDPAEIAPMGPSAIVLSPGPCTPSEAPCSLEIVRRYHATVPLLGICLGHQIIVEALGGRVVPTAPVHGRASAVFHHGAGVFAQLPDPFYAGRYHSLAAQQASLPSELSVTAWTADGTIMAVEHRFLPVVGLQFHPESILTEHGYGILAGFLKQAGLAPSASPPDFGEECVRPPTHTVEAAAPSDE